MREWGLRMKMATRMRIRKRERAQADEEDEKGEKRLNEKWRELQK